MKLRLAFASVSLLVVTTLVWWSFSLASDTQFAARATATIRPCPTAEIYTSVPAVAETAGGGGYPPAVPHFDGTDTPFPTIPPTDAAATRRANEAREATREQTRRDRAATVLAEQATLDAAYLTAGPCVYPGTDIPTLTPVEPFEGPVEYATYYVVTVEGTVIFVSSTRTPTPSSTPEP